MLFAFNLSVLAQEEDEERDILETAIYGGVNMPVGGLADYTFENLNNGEQIAAGAKAGSVLGIDFGVFLTSDLVIGANLSYAKNSSEEAPGIPYGDLKNRFYSPSLYLKYYFFSESNAIPYLKIHGGIDNPRVLTMVYDQEDGQNKMSELSYGHSFAFGAGGGLFYYTSDYSGLYLEGNFHYGMTKSATGEYMGGSPLELGFNSSSVEIHAGIKVFFSGGE
jgi:hypothetical protein